MVESVVMSVVHGFLAVVGKVEALGMPTAGWVGH